MFEKKNKRSSSRTRDDPPEFGFDYQPDLAKLYWEGPRLVNNQVAGTLTDCNTQDKKDCTAHENSNMAHRPSFVSARLDDTAQNASCVPYNSRPASSLGMCSFQSPESPTSKYVKHRKKPKPDFENTSYDTKQDRLSKYSKNETNRDHKLFEFYKTSFESIDNSYSSADCYASSRPGSSLGMGIIQSPVAPTTSFAKQRRGSRSDLEDNSSGSKDSSYWRSKSVDMSRNRFCEYQPINTKTGKSAANENEKKLIQHELSSTSRNNSYRTCQTPYNSHHRSPVSSEGLRRAISRSDTFYSATRFDDTASSTCTLRYSQGSNEDLEKVLRDLDNTGYFAEILPPSSRPERETNKTRKSQNYDCPTVELKYKKLWEESLSENTNLRLEMGELKNELESVKTQMETMAIQAVNHKSLSDMEKREKKIVAKKLEEMEEELRLLAYSEKLTDQTLELLRVDNSRLRMENQALMRDMSKNVK